MTGIERLFRSALMAVMVMGSGASLHAALFWSSGVRVRDISVCFVGDAMTSRPARIQQILTYIKEFQYAANIRFQLLGTGVCPPATTTPAGQSNFAGDIRVVIPGTSVAGTGIVPGTGCQMFIVGGTYNSGNDGWGSWSNSPDEAQTTTNCLYNLKLGDDPWNGVPYLNHTLHEFGHALGLAHEHERDDVDKTICTESGFGGGASTGKMTPYDRRSVMHYQFTPCNIDGNYGYSGLSEWDRLAAHILYPEDARVAELTATFVVPVGKPFAARSAWLVRGANLAFVAPGFQWKVDGVSVSTTSQMSQVLSGGDHTLDFSHSDFLSRNYSYRALVRVLPVQAYAALTRLP